MLRKKIEKLIEHYEKVVEDLKSGPHPLDVMARFTIDISLIYIKQLKSILKSSPKPGPKSKKK